MCDKIKENPKPWIIGGVAGVIVLIVVIVLAVTLSDDGGNNNKDADDISVDSNDTSMDTNDTSSSSSSSDKTNILFIIVDDLGWTDISRHGGNFETPNIDAIYDIGIEFTNYYVHPVCTPTRASFLTGKYAWRTGLQNIQTMLPCVPEAIPFDTPTVAELLKNDELGYSTYYVGKWHLGYGQWEMTPTGRGFDKGVGLLQGRGFYYKHTLPLVGNISGFDMFVLDEQRPYWEVEGNYSTDIFYNTAIDYLSRHISGGVDESNPFYMYLSWQTIHEPMDDPPPVFVDGDDDYYPECGSQVGEREVYCNKMKYFDEKIGDLISYLVDNDLYDNTLIVLTTDNGGIVHYESTMPQPPLGFYMPQSYGCNYPYRAGKATLFEGGIKGIGVMAGKMIQDMGLANTTNDLLIHSVDWMATFIEGVNDIDNLTQFTLSDDRFNPMTSPFDSVNLFDYLNDEDKDSFSREYIYPNIDDKNALYGNFKFSEDDDIPEDGLNETNCVIWNDKSTNTMWKYIGGLNLYWNYYDCDQTTYSDQPNLYLTTYEWLFNLTDNPYEDESLNYLSPNMTNDILSQYGLTSDDINNITLHLKNRILYEQSRGYIQKQDVGGFNYVGLPGCNDGVWAPWLDSDGEQFITLEECIQMLNLTNEYHVHDNTTYWYNLSEHYIHKFITYAWAS